MRRVYGIGDELKAEIKKHGLKQNFVANKIGVPLPTFEAWLANTTGIPEITLKGILFTFPQFDRKLFCFTDSAQQRLPLKAQEKEAASA